MRLLLTVLLAAATACASAPKVSVTTSVTDQEYNAVSLAARVKTALLNDAIVGKRRIDVHVTGYDVRLTGRVESAQERDRAVQVASGVDGVRSVKSDLDVRKSPSESGSR